MRRLLALSAPWLAAALLPAAAAATTVVPVADADLVNDAAAVVIGRVSAIEGHADGGRIFTNISVDVDEVLKGDAVTRMVVKQPGGSVNGVHAWIDGSPEFHVGERVLLFLSANRDGTPRILHLYQGKFRLVPDAAGGDEVATRETPASVSVPAGVAGHVHVPPPLARRLGELRDLVRRHHGASSRRGAAPLVSATAPATAVTETHAAFTYLGSPSRWFEPDGGHPVAMKINSAGEPTAPGRGFEQVRAAFVPWSTVAGSSFRYADGGATTAGGFRNDGVSAISFGDPLGDIDPPSGCSGTLAYGGYFRSNDAKTVNGRSFFRIIEGDIVFADGWAGCGFYESFARMAEVATHELGHVLGLDHSADPDATMYAFVHWDGRGAAIRADDVAGLKSMYPGTATATPLALTFTNPASGATVSGTTTVTMSASGGAGYSYRVAVDGTTVYSGTNPSFAWNTTTAANSSHTLTATVTDSSSRTASATRTVTVSNVTPTAGLTVAVTAPKASATVSGTTWVIVWVQGAAAGSNTYTLSAGGKTVATQVSASTGPVSIAWNTTGTANGAQTLMATLKDAAGKTGTRSLPVTVSNATTTPAPSPTLTAAFTSPLAGATVRGTVSVSMTLSGSTAATRTFKLAVDGAVVSTQTIVGTSATYAWSTTTVANGGHTLTLTATDSAGRSATAARSVTVSNTTIAPPPTGTLKVAVTAPRPGTTVRGTVWPVVWVEGAAAGAKVFTLSVNGQTLATQTTTSSGPVAMPWNTAVSGNGSRGLSATVRDAAGRTATTVVTVTVAN